MANKKLCADRDIIAQFITIITADWSNTPHRVGGFEIRCLGKNRTTVSQTFELNAVSEATDLAVQMNANKLNVYMTINPIDVDAIAKSGKSAKGRNECKYYQDVAHGVSLILVFTPE